MANPFNQAHVFSLSPSGDYLNAGTLSIQDELGSFTYSALWLNNPWAYPLDPINLPLAPKRYTTDNVKSVFGVFTDAGPDDWGNRILMLQYQTIPSNEIERLLRSSGNGVGNLRFSQTATEIKEHHAFSSINQIQKLELAAKKLQEKHPLSKEELQLLEPGSSMGGARPKVSVTDTQGRTWLAKFSKSSDFINVPLVEFATMKLLARCGINTPNTQLITLSDDQHVFLIERFDKLHNTPTHFISANSLFNISRVRTVRDSKLNPYSYVNLARILRKTASNPIKGCAELFKRMVLNILIGNTDDHARNHALLYDIKQSQWNLSPVYDVVPIVESTQAKQSLGVGKLGGDSTLENALSYCHLFGLSEKQAKEEIEKIKFVLENWKTLFLDEGVKPVDIELLAKVIDQRLNESL